MISFNNDYNNGCHKDILKALVETNDEITNVYTEDIYSKEAKIKIKEVFGIEKGEVFFLSGGTQTNLMAIDTMISDYEGVMSPYSGHINVHEAGAIEHSGHKVIPLDAKDGKVNKETVAKYLEWFYGDDTNAHMVKPGMLYVSFPTEYGTLYSKYELKGLYDVCKKYNVKFYIDGARLLYGLYSKENDVDIKDLKTLCDAFYIGGTKEGTLIGEALVFNNETPDMFITRIKMHGAMLAKGRNIGVQFKALFTDKLYEKIGSHAIEMANKLKTIFKEKGYKLFIDSPTNQQFVILSNDKIEELKNNVEFSIWEKVSESEKACRFVTSWATKNEDIEELKKYL